MIQLEVTVDHHLCPGVNLKEEGMIKLNADMLVTTNVVIITIIIIITIITIIITTPMYNIAGSHS